LAYANASAKVSKNSSGRKVKAKEMSQEEKMWKARVKHAVFDGTWHMNKFCNDGNRLVQLTRKTMRFMQLTELQGLTDEKLARKEMKWIVANKDSVRTSLNTIRNEVGGGIRKEYIDRVGRPVQHEEERWKPDFYAELTEEQVTAIKANVGKNKADWKAVPEITNLRLGLALCVPTLQDILDCITREPHLMNTEKGKATFDDYWDRWLWKTAGRANWDTNKRHHHTISLARRDADGEPCIDPGMEAFTFILFENQQYRHSGLAIAKMGGAKYNAKETNTSPWTDADKGQLPWGGWTTPGQARWKIMRAKVKDARGRDHVEQMEAECLARLRAKHRLGAGVGAATAPSVARMPEVPPAEDSDNELFG